MKKATALACIGTLAVTTLATATTATAAPKQRESAVTYQTIATHPTASVAGYAVGATNYTGTPLCTAEGVQPAGPMVDWDGDGICAAGRAIEDMAFDSNGNLIAGHGEWNYNLDSYGTLESRPSIIPLDVETMTWGPALPVGSESIDIIREREGSLFVPITDPSARGGNIGGYWTNKGGTWHRVKHITPSVHVIDVTSVGGTVYSNTEYVLSGQNATAVEVSDGLSATTSSVEDVQTLGYWPRNAWLLGTEGGTLHRAYQSFTRSKINGAWASNAYQSGSNPGLAEQWQGKAVEITPDLTLSILSSDGSVTTEPFPGYGVRDVYAENGGAGALYVLSSNGVFRKATPSAAWRKVSDLPAEATTSLAVRDGHVYLGTTEGKIMRTNTPVNMDSLRKINIKRR